jgi:hypothetical protein
MLAILLAGERFGLGGRDVRGFYTLLSAVMVNAVCTYSIPRLPLRRGRIVSIALGVLALIAILILR